MHYSHWLDLYIVKRPQFLGNGGVKLNTSHKSKQVKRKTQ